MLVNQSNKLNVDYDVSDDLKDGILLEDVRFEQVIHCLATLFFDRYDRSLTTVEILILKGIWQSKTYSEIAQESNYSPGYFTNVAAPKLLKRLSELVGSRITKKSCRSLVTKYLMKNTLNLTQNYDIKRRENLTSKDLFLVRKFSCQKQVSLFDSSFLQDTIYFAQMI